MSNTTFYGKSSIDFGGVTCYILTNTKARLDSDLWMIGLCKAFFKEKTDLDEK